MKPILRCTFPAANETKLQIDEIDLWTSYMLLGN